MANAKKTRGKWSKWLSSPLSQMGIFWMDEVIEAVMGHSLQSMLHWTIQSLLSKWLEMWEPAQICPFISPNMSISRAFSGLEMREPYWIICPFISQNMLSLYLKYLEHLADFCCKWNGNFINWQMCWKLLACGNSLWIHEFLKYFKTELSLFALN